MTFAPHTYTVPHALRRKTEGPMRALIVGSCAIGSLSEHVGLHYGVECDFFNVNHGCLLPEEPPRPASDYDFQIIQIPIRMLVPEAHLMRLAYADISGYRTLFDHARAVLDMSLGNVLRWSKDHGLPAFVTNFLTPQQNSVGRLFPRYDLRNIVYFVEELNRELAGMIAGYENVFLLDSDHLSAVFGKRRIQDDSVALFCHGALISGYDELHDGDRLNAPPTTVAESLDADVPTFLLAIWEEAVAMWRTLRQIDSVKLIIVDLDDTLWRGVVAEGNEISPHVTEGWPIGFVEALLEAKRRGIMLAVASKNDNSRICDLWPALYGGRLEIADFAAWKVGWSSKVQSIQSILSDINVLSKDVLFIDDNPVERAAISEAYPEMRVIGEDPYILRRIILWSPETQVSVISEESGRRTQMVQSQIRREADRTTFTADDFLRGLAPRVRFFEISDTLSNTFERAHELLNKTNQFNTTGQRWSKVEIAEAIKNGLSVYAFTVNDTYTDYGLVGVILTCRQTIVQFVLSCRVFGLGVEDAAISLLRSKFPFSEDVVALIKRTPVNGPSQTVWPRLGFVEVDGAFVLKPTIKVDIPGHVTIIDETHGVDLSVE